MNKILITGAIHPSENLYMELTSLGFEIDFLQNEIEEHSCDFSQYRAVICNSLFMKNDIDRFTSLETIHLTSAGLDRVPLERIRERGINLYNAAGVYSTPMAEWAICSILSLYKNFAHFHRAQSEQRWDKNRDIRELSGSRALVVGMGSVGREVAKRLWAMEVTVCGVDIEVIDNLYIEKCYTIDMLEEVIGGFDIVVLTLPLTAETHHLFNRNIFEEMHRGALLVNLSRGAVVDTESLEWALSEGKIWGAALDVFEHEPLPSSSPLWHSSRVLVTPHNSFCSDKNQLRLEQLIVKNLAQHYE